MLEAVLQKARLYTIGFAPRGDDLGASCLQSQSSPDGGVTCTQPGRPGNLAVGGLNEDGTPVDGGQNCPCEINGPPVHLNSPRLGAWDYDADGVMDRSMRGQAAHHEQRAAVGAALVAERAPTPATATFLRSKPGWRLMQFHMLSLMEFCSAIPAVDHVDFYQLRALRMG